MGKADQSDLLAGCNLTMPFQDPCGQDRAWLSQTGAQSNQLSSEVDLVVLGPCSEASWEDTGMEEGCLGWTAGSQVEGVQREGVEEEVVVEEVWLLLVTGPLSRE